MNPNKLTQKSIEAVQTAQDLSVSYQNNCVEQAHLLYALLSDEGGLLTERRRELENKYLIPEIRTASM